MHYIGLWNACKLFVVCNLLFALQISSQSNIAKSSILLTSFVVYSVKFKIKLDDLCILV